MLCNGDFRTHLWWCETAVLSKCSTETVKTETNSAYCSNERQNECKCWKILSVTLNNYFKTKIHVDSAAFVSFGLDPGSKQAFTSRHSTISHSTAPGAVGSSCWACVRGAQHGSSRPEPLASFPQSRTPSSLLFKLRLFSFFTSRN